jgi:hypothetical protein
MALSAILICNGIHRIKSPFAPFEKGGWGDLGHDVRRLHQSIETARPARRPISGFKTSDHARGQGNISSKLKAQSSKETIHSASSFRLSPISCEHFEKPAIPPSGGTIGH